MYFETLAADDSSALDTAAEIYTACNAVDDPDEPPTLVADLTNWIRHGWDLNPSKHWIVRDDEGAAVGMAELGLPVHDNLHWADGGVSIRPELRRQGLGTRAMDELEQRARSEDRTVLGCWCGEDDSGVRRFLEGRGFTYASHDARRIQRLADVDRDDVDRLHATALEAASDYRLERHVGDVDDEVLAELVDVTSAINDAPIGDLSIEDEVFDVARLRDVQTAAQRRGDRFYRVVARHRHTGEVGGHTVVSLSPHRPEMAGQGDTAVHRDHRGHRLGMLLKIDMLNWLREAEPQLERIDTWNHADNSYMINVNEAIGYRLSKVFAAYEKKLDV